MRVSSQFYAFTYLFRTVQGPIQQQTDQELTPELVIQKRNQFFMETLINESATGDRSITLGVKRPRSRIRLIEKQVDNDGHITLAHFEINAQRGDTKYLANFTKEEFTNFPYTTVLIAPGDNDQLILIRKNNEAFPDIASAAKAIVSHANKYMRSVGQEISVNPMLESMNFWEIVDAYSGRISKVEFVIPPPNLPRTRKTIADAIQALEKSTGASEGRITLAAAPSESLELSETNDQLRALVESPKEGTPTPRLKPQGSNKWEKVSGRPKYMRLGQDQLTGLFRDGLLNKIRRFIHGADNESDDTDNNDS